MDQVAAPHVSMRELAGYLHATSLELDGNGDPLTPLVFVGLDRGAPVDPATTAAAASGARSRVLVGVAPDGLDAAAHPLAAELACTVSGAAAGSRSEVATEDLDATLGRLDRAVGQCPRAAVTLVGLVRATATLAVPDALVAESAAYSMLLAGAEFARWRAARPVRPVPVCGSPAVLVNRTGGRLEVTIDRPHRHNAFSRDVRDGLVDAFDLALLDPGVGEIRLTGNGASFCSGGDLDEFGTTSDVTTAHLIRLDRSVAGRVWRCRDRVTAVLHGACIGAGIEIAAFAGRVVARADTAIQLPELAMGLVPGAGGTVSVTTRIGRWRTAYLGLTGESIGPELARQWGLVDEVAG